MLPSHNTPTETLGKVVVVIPPQGGIHTKQLAIRLWLGMDASLRWHDSVFIIVTPHLLRGLGTKPRNARHPVRTQ